MTNSTKLIMKMMIAFAAISAVFAIINSLRGGEDDFFFGAAIISGIIAGVSFIAFLLALIVSSSKGN